MQSDESRFEAVFHDHFDAVLRFALARADPDAAKDVAAETFMVAWQALDRLPPEPRGWLIAVARNKVADHYRAGERREALISRIAQIFPESSADPSGTALGMDSVSVAFHTLRRSDQEVLRLLAWDRVPLRQAGSIGHIGGAMNGTILIRPMRVQRPWPGAPLIQSWPPGCWPVGPERQLDPYLRTGSYRRGGSGSSTSAAHPASTRARIAGARC